MNEEKMIYELEKENETCNQEVTITELEPEEPAESGILGKLVGGVIVTGIVGGIAYVAANKDKIKQRRNEKMAEKLAKAGYAVYGPGESEEVQVVEEEDIVEEETTE